jgi:hypothetical protein
MLRPESAGYEKRTHLLTAENKCITVLRYHCIDERMMTQVCQLGVRLVRRDYALHLRAAL